MPAPRPTLRTRAELALARLVRQWHRHRPRALEPSPPQRFIPCDIPPATADTTPASVPAGDIPRIVWTYWDGVRPPALVQACLDTWRRHAGAFELRILDDACLGDWIEALPPGVQHDPVRRSDWLRLELLRRHGGVWLDASTILTRSLDWVLDAQQAAGADLVGYYLRRYTTDPRYPVVENWCMAAPPGSRFVADLHAEFTTHVLAGSNDDYIARLVRLGQYEQVRQGIEIPHYLSMHLAAQVVMQTRGGYRLSLCAAEEGPLFYHHASGWNRNALRMRLLLRPAGDAVPALVKLRKPDRRRLDTYIDAGLALPGSLVARYLAPAA